MAVLRFGFLSGRFRSTYFAQVAAASAVPRLPAPTLVFGRSVLIDQLTFYLRADFPHDAWWNEASITFSDGDSASFPLRKTGAAQSFPVAPRRVEWIRLHDLKKADDPSPFPALTDAPEIAVLWPVRLEPELVLTWSPHMKMVSLPDPVITCDVLAMAVPLSTETTTLLSPLPALMTLPAPRAV